MGLHRNYRSELATRAMGRYDVTQVEDDQEIQQLDYDHIFICGTATDEFREAMQKHYGTTKVTTHAGDFTSLMSALRDLKQRINQGDRR